MKSLNALKRAANVAASLANDADSSLAKMVAAVSDFHAENRYAPSVQDLATALGWTKERARDHVRALLESGHLTMREGVGHSLRVATDGEQHETRVRAWNQALRSLPASEAEAASVALASLRS